MVTQDDPMLLLHGVVGSAAGVRPLADALSARFDVRTPDLLGHGGRPMPDDYSVDAIVDDLLAWLDEQRLGRVRVFGYSIGGYVALRLAQRHPERVRSICTLATPATFAGPTVRYMRRLLNADRLDQLAPERVAEMTAIHAPESWRRVAEADERLMLSLRDRPLLGASELGALKPPVLVMTAERELIGGVDEAQVFHRALPGAQLCILPGKAHPIGHVDLDRLVEAVVAFADGEEVQSIRVLRAAAVERAQALSHMVRYAVAAQVRGSRRRVRALFGRR